MSWRDTLLVGAATTCAAVCVACTFAWDDYRPSGGNPGGNGGSGATDNTGGMGLGGSGVVMGGGGTASAGNGGTGGTGGTGGGGGPILADFSDDFERPDGDGIGFGWIEKTSDAFKISAGQAIKNPNSFDYRDNMVYRPVIENQRDVAVSVEFELTDSGSAYPQVFVRAQPSTITTADTYDGYLLYVFAEGSVATLTRQEGAGFAITLKTFPLLDPIIVGTRYRLTLSATGTNPVALTASVERKDGLDWAPLAGGIFSDSSAARFDGPGSVGFSANQIGDFFYDNFTRTTP